MITYIVGHDIGSVAGFTTLESAKNWVGEQCGGWVDWMEIPEWERWEGAYDTGPDMLYYWIDKIEVEP